MLAGRHAQLTTRHSLRVASHGCLLHIPLCRAPTAQRTMRSRRRPPPWAPGQQRRQPWCHTAWLSEQTISSMQSAGRLAAQHTFCRQARA